jgi:hypothetical protein
VALLLITMRKPVNFTAFQVVAKRTFSTFNLVSGTMLITAGAATANLLFAALAGPVSENHEHEQPINNAALSLSLQMKQRQDDKRRLHASETTLPPRDTFFRPNK